jgi:hypothetical protein
MIRSNSQSVFIMFGDVFLWIFFSRKKFSSGQKCKGQIVKCFRWETIATDIKWHKVTDCISSCADGIEALVWDNLVGGIVEVSIQLALNISSENLRVHLWTLLSHFGDCQALKRAIMCLTSPKFIVRIPFIRRWTEGRSFTFSFSPRMSCVDGSK